MFLNTFVHAAERQKAMPMCETRLSDHTKIDTRPECKYEDLEAFAWASNYSAHGEYFSITR